MYKNSGFFQFKMIHIFLSFCYPRFIFVLIAKLVDSKIRGHEKHITGALFWNIFSIFGQIYIDTFLNNI